MAGSKFDQVARHHIWFGSFTPNEQELLLSPEVLYETDSDIYRDARAIVDECDSPDLVDTNAKH